MRVTWYKWTKDWEEWREVDVRGRDEYERRELTVQLIFIVVSGEMDEREFPIAEEWVWASKAVASWVQRNRKGEWRLNHITLPPHTVLNGIHHIRRGQRRRGDNKGIARGRGCRRSRSRMRVRNRDPCTSILAFVVVKAMGRWCGTWWVVNSIYRGARHRPLNESTLVWSGKLWKSWVVGVGRGYVVLRRSRVV